MVQYPSAQGLMSGPLGGWLTEQVAVRAEAKRKASGRLRLVLLVLVPASLAILALLPTEIDQKIALIGFLGMMGYGWTRLPIRAAEKAVKGGINDAVARSLGLTYAIDCEGGEEFALAQGFRLVPSHDRASFEDRWEGAVEGHAFSLHEAHLEERRGSGKNRRWVTVFRGAIIRIGFAQSFHGTTLVAREGRFGKLFGGRKDSVDLGGMTLDLAAMVSPQFEDVFDVYTTDQTEARWIVHPSYIERLVGIEQAFQGENIAALFTGGAAVIVLASGNQFESGSIDPEEDHARLETTIAQFQRLADLALDLNTVRAVD